MSNEPSHGNSDWRHVEGVMIEAGTIISIVVKRILAGGNLVCRLMLAFLGREVSSQHLYCGMRYRECLSSIHPLV